MLSATCKYGIRAVIFIASKPEQKSNTGLKEIAEKLKIPQPYLAKNPSGSCKEKDTSFSQGTPWWLLPADSVVKADSDGHYRCY